MREEPGMTIHDRRRTDPVATHAYTVPVVRELAGCLSGHAAPGPDQPGPRLAHAADTNAW
jgi:hypothetical protein